MTRAAASTLGLALALAACKQGGSGENLHRSRDAGAGVVMVDRTPGTAADRPAEKEPDNDAASASPLGDGVRGTLDGETDVDAFSIASPGPQVLAAQLTAIAGVDTKLEVRDERFALIAASDRGGAAAAEAVAGVPLDKGTYFVVVREVPHHKKPPKKDADAGVGRSGPSPTYELTATLAAPGAGDVEREPNDDAGEANDLTLAEPVTGHLGWSGDVDEWKLGVDAFTEGNGLDVAVSGLDGVALTVQVTDAAGRSLMKSTGAPGQPVTLKSLAPRITPGDAPVHYVVVSGKPSSPDAYTLTVTSRLLDLDEEAEPNDRTTVSTPLRFGSEDQGSMRGLIGPGDVDVYRLSESPSPASLDVAVDAPPGIDIAVEAILGNGSSIGKADLGKAGAAESLAGLAIPAGTMVFLQITEKPDKKVTAPGPYQLRWSLSAAAPPPAPGSGSDQDPLPPEE